MSYTVRRFPLKNEPNGRPFVRPEIEEICYGGIDERNMTQHFQL
jgi:hypothetical protein